MSLVSPSTCSTCSTTPEEVLDSVKLDVVLTNKGLQVYGTWSKEKLLKLLMERLKQTVHTRPSTLKKISDGAVNDKRLWMTINSGIYSVRVLKELQNKGMSVHSIIKAMKLGLISLSHCELLYFREFQIEPHLLEFKEMWSRKFGDELILNLRATGLNETECWNVIVYGVVLQNKNILHHLVLCGIDVPGILKWQSPINFASPKIIEFLRYIGIRERDVELVQQFGIDEETELMLIDLGLNEMEDTFLSMEEIICQCSLTILEPSNSYLNLTRVCQMDDSKSSATYSNVSDYAALCGCQCHILEENKTEAEIVARRNDYLRQNIMVPLTWAMARTLRYKPTDPLHYMAYQLLRWIHNNVDQEKKDCLHQIFALSTMVMDYKLVMKKHMEEEAPIGIHNREVMKNVPCDICNEREELHRVKKQCWKYVKRPLKQAESCKFTQLCSSCKINVSDKSEDLSMLQVPAKTTSNPRNHRGYSVNSKTSSEIEKTVAL